MVRASIITIGDELLIGQVIDTNSAWIAQQLNKVGIPVVRRVAVGDSSAELKQSLDEELTHAEIILLTGGLGPTNDDVTKPVLCEYFNAKMVMNQQVLEHVTHLFEKIFKRPLSDVNRLQAEVPDCCTVLSNLRGSAPGMLFEKNGRIIISMPGVPHEMKGIVESEIIPLLQKRFNLPPVQHRTLLTAGIGESLLAEHIKDFENDLPKNISLAYLPNYGIVRLRLSSPVVTAAAMDEIFNQLLEKVKPYLVTNEDDAMHVVVGKWLAQNNKTICTAESCTGGYIAHQLTEKPGSSKFFNGSVICYSNKVKQEILGVRQDTLETYGAVSEQVVKEMLQGVLQKIPSDYGIAVSGIMGPGGGTAEKPVGTVWVAVGGINDIETQKLHFRFDREKNIELTAVQALNMLRVHMKKKG